MPGSRRRAFVIDADGASCTVVLLGRAGDGVERFDFSVHFAHEAVTARIRENTPRDCALIIDACGKGSFILLAGTGENIESCDRSIRRTYKTAGNRGPIAP